MDTFELRPFTQADRDWIVAAHIDTYSRVEGFDDTFGVLVAQIVDDFLTSHDPVNERGWIAWQKGVRLGSIFCVRIDAQTAQLRLFQLAPQARGLGLGRHMLETCTQFARDTGYSSMKLWTHKSHTAACALYKRNGWRVVDERPVQHFGKSLIEQVMSIPLDA